MKKALLIMLALLTVTACSSGRGEPDESVRWIDVYYIDGEDEIISSEQRAIDAEDNITAMIRTAIEQMQEKPIDKDLKPLLPEKAGLLGVRFEHGLAKIEFSEEYLTLGGMDRTLADYGIVMTLSNFWNIRAVEITVGGTVVTPEISAKDIVTELPKG